MTRKRYSARERVRLFDLHKGCCHLCAGSAAHHAATTRGAATARQGTARNRGKEGARPEGLRQLPAHHGRRDGRGEGHSDASSDDGSASGGAESSTLSAGTSKNQLSSHAMPRSNAAERIAFISSAVGATPFSHRDTDAWVTPASAANSAWVALNTVLRMKRIALIRQRYSRTDFCQGKKYMNEFYGKFSCP